ncbi:hypothetical protein SBADM41S_01777 [Streptomyces badius]
MVAGVSVVGAAGAWLLAEPLALRGLVAAVAAAAVTGAYLMRSWDRAAGLRVAELTRARASDEWRAEERIAELEQDLEESRELRTRLETKLRRKRVELAGLRGEHAGLLRRYANAEAERASALEGRRQLAIEAAAPKELLPARSTPTPESYRRADEALMNLTRNAALQETRRTVEAVRQRQLAVAERHRDAEAESPEGKRAAATGAGEHRAHQHGRPSTTPPAPATNAQHPAQSTTPATDEQNTAESNAQSTAQNTAPASIAPVRAPRAIAAALSGGRSPPTPRRRSAARWSVSSVLASVLAAVTDSATGSVTAAAQASSATCAVRSQDPSGTGRTSRPPRKPVSVPKGGRASRPCA